MARNIALSAVARLLVPILFAAYCAGGYLPAYATDVTNSLSVQKSGLILNRSTGTFDTIISVTNTGSASLFEPFWILVKSTSPDIILLDREDRDINGQDFKKIVVPNGTLNQGQTTKVILQFQNQNSIPFGINVALDAQFSAAVSPELVLSQLADTIASNELDAAAELFISVQKARETLGSLSASQRGSIAISLRSASLVRDEGNIRYYSVPRLSPSGTKVNPSISLIHSNTTGRWQILQW